MGVIFGVEECTPIGAACHPYGEKHPKIAPLDKTKYADGNYGKVGPICLERPM